MTDRELTKAIRQLSEEQLIEVLRFAALVKMEEDGQEPERSEYQKE